MRSSASGCGRSASGEPVFACQDDAGGRRPVRMWPAVPDRASSPAVAEKGPPPPEPGQPHG